MWTSSGAGCALAAAPFATATCSPRREQTSRPTRTNVISRAPASTRPSRGTSSPPSRSNRCTCACPTLIKRCHEHVARLRLAPLGKPCWPYWTPSLGHASARAPLGSPRAPRRTSGETARFPPMPLPLLIGDGASDEHHGEPGGFPSPGAARPQRDREDRARVVPHAVVPLDVRWGAGEAVIHLARRVRPGDARSARLPDHQPLRRRLARDEPRRLAEASPQAHCGGTPRAAVRGHGGRGPARLHTRGARLERRRHPALRASRLQGARRAP